MRNVFKQIGIIAFVAVIGFGLAALSLTGCGGGGGVIPPVPVIGVTLNKSSLSLNVGNTETLTATVAPANATNQAVTWSTSNVTVATVSNGVVTAVAAGSAIIIVTTADGGITAECSVDVNDPSLTFTSIADFKIWLDAQPDNTATTAYNVKLNVSGPGGGYIPGTNIFTVGSIGNALTTNINKYVSLDLSGSTFTSIGDWAFFGCTSLTSVTFATGSNIPDANFDNFAFDVGNLKTAYSTGKAGTYTRKANGYTWTKQS